MRVSRGNGRAIREQATEPAAPGGPPSLVESEQPAEPRDLRAVGRWWAKPGKGRPRQEIVTFADLVWEHWRWERRRHAGEIEPEVEGDYRSCLAAFQSRFGEIVESYWSIRDASGVALTIGHERSRPGRRPDAVPRYHGSIDWATREEPGIAEVLNECGTLAIRVGEVLRGSSELIALRRIVAVASHLLGFVDRAHGRPDETGVFAVAGEPVDGSRAGRRPDHRHRTQEAHFAAEQRKELAKIEVFYDRAGNKQARIVYFWGMVLGYLYLLPLAAVTVVLVWVVDGLDGKSGHWAQIQALIACMAAGPLGALLSVLTRIASSSGKFEIDYEVGRKQVRWLGIYRPLLGAIFGVATYLLLASGLLQTTTPSSGSGVAYYGALAFLAGFFERFMKIAPGGAPFPGGPEAEEKDPQAKAAGSPPPASS